MRYVLLFLCLCPGLALAQDAARPKFEQEDRVVFLGNTFAERLYHFGHLELLLASRFENLNLSFRNLGWSADEITIAPRPLDFGSIHEHLTIQQADVVFLFYGFNESFAGEAGLADFRREYGNFLDGLLAHNFNGATPARLVCVTPYPMEPKPGIIGGVEKQNADIALYAQAIVEVAAERDLPCADIHDAVRDWQAAHPDHPLTFNGIHLTAFGDWVVSRIILQAIGLPPESPEFAQDVANPKAYVRGPGVQVVSTGADNTIELELRLDRLLDVDPPADAPEGAPHDSGAIRLGGLPKGRYVLTLPGGATLEGDDAAWAAGVPLPASPFVNEAEGIRGKINFKNRLFFDKWRAINGYYIYGGRKEPFGVISFPPEMEVFEERVTDYEGRIAQDLKKPLAVRAMLRRVGE